MLDHDAMPDSYSGVVSVSNSVTTLGDEVRQPTGTLISRYL